jgi:hypothetical protein
MRCCSGKSEFFPALNRVVMKVRTWSGGTPESGPFAHGLVTGDWVWIDGAPPSVSDFQWRITTIDDYSFYLDSWEMPPIEPLGRKKGKRHKQPHSAAPSVFWSQETGRRHKIKYIEQCVDGWLKVAAHGLDESNVIEIDCCQGNTALNGTRRLVLDTPPDPDWFLPTDDGPIIPNGTYVNDSGYLYVTFPDDV